MATNSFLPFGNAGGANVATAADYSANSGYAVGYQSGVAQSKYLNFTWRQSSLMTAALGQLIADFGLVNAVDDGVVVNLETALVAGIRGAAPGRLTGIRVLTVSGVYTAPAGTKSIMVELVGGGGGGGGALQTTSSQVAAGAGGGAGGYSRSYLTSNFSGVSVTVGNAGSVSAGANGGTGGATSFGSILSASGGGGGTAGAAVAPTGTSVNGGAAGGVGSGGNLLNSGGGGGVYAIYASAPISGAGGATPLGAGGLGAANTASGNNSPSYGGGGGGGVLQGVSPVSATGGAGGAGAVIIWEYA